MGLLFIVPVLLFTLYLSSFPVQLFKNYLIARKYDYPIIIVPVNPNHFLWLIFVQLSGKWLKRTLPRCIWWRLSITIYGWEYHERRLPFKMLNTDTFMLVTCEMNEIWTVNNEILAEIGRRPGDFVLTDIGAFIMNIFGPNLATSQGEAWTRQRKLLTSVINERISKVVFEESWAQSRAMVNDIELEASKEKLNQSFDEKTTSKTSPKEPATYTDTFPSMKRIASNVLFRSAYGLPQTFKRPVKANSASHRAALKLDIVDCISLFVANLVPMAFLPTRLLSGWPSWLPLASWAHELGTAKDQFPVLVEERLEEEKTAIKSGSDAKVNLTSMLIQSSDFGADISSNADKVKDNGKQMLTIDELRGNMFVFTTAGFETTTNVLTYALVILMAQPELQTWLFEEIDHLFKDYRNGEEVDYASIYPKAIRCLALMMEVMRMYPPIVHIARISNRTKATTIKTSDRKYGIPADTHIYGPAPSLHTDPHIWRNLNISEEEDTGKVPESSGDPIVETMDDVLRKTQDEYKIRPSRWINKQLKEMPDGTMSQSLFQPPRGSYLPFSSGPRVCPGQKMAQVEFVTVILGLLKDYKIEAAKKAGETDADLRKRLQETLLDCHAELTVVMDNLGDVEAQFIKRVKI